MERRRPRASWLLRPLRGRQPSHAHASSRAAWMDRLCGSTGGTGDSVRAKTKFLPPRVAGTRHRQQVKALAFQILPKNFFEARLSRARRIQGTCYPRRSGRLCGEPGVVAQLRGGDGGLEILAPHLPRWPIRARWPRRTSPRPAIGWPAGPPPSPELPDRPPPTPIARVGLHLPGRPSGGSIRRMRPRRWRPGSVGQR